MNKIELLAPAGDLEKAKFALLYGADAVYIGGKKFSLRYFASNFTNEDILELVNFAHHLDKKVYVTVNMVMHDEDLTGLKEYLQYLKDIKVDAIIASSIFVLKTANEINLETHMSTQLSLLNEEAVNFYFSLGSKRIVLGRELNLEEIKDIKAHTKAEIEVFIHGGMCSSYSGRCMLSQYMCDRDPNRGGCAHSCRWEYHLYDKNQNPLFDKEDYFAISSKDLCAINEITELIKAGVSSLKIEGRMKSINYLAYIVSAYRRAIDDYYNNESHPEDYLKLISSGEYRSTGHGFFHGNVTINESLIDLKDNFDRPGEFIGVVINYDEDKKLAEVEIKNKIEAHQKYQILSIGGHLQEITIGKIYYNDNEVEKFTIAQEKVLIESKQILKPHSLIHKIC